MKIGPVIKKLLNKPYPPQTLVEAKAGNTDLAFKTDELGRPVLLFIGKKMANGHIKGERFARVLKNLSDGTTKDHWENKGTAS